MVQSCRLTDREHTVAGAPVVRAVDRRAERSVVSSYLFDSVLLPGVPVDGSDHRNAGDRMLRS